MRATRSHLWSFLIAAIFVVAACSSSGDGGADTTIAPDVIDDSGGGTDILQDVPSGEDTLPPGDVPVTSDTSDDSSAPEDVSQDIDPANPGPAPEHQREAFELPTGTLKAGVAVGYVTGPVGVSMAGYGGRSDGVASTWSAMMKGSRGFVGYHTAKAIALEVDGERLILMKVPVMSGEESYLDLTAQKLRDDYGLELEGRILMGATHSHHTIARYWRLPSLMGFVGADEPDEEIIDRFSTVFADTIARAVDDLDTAEWGFTYLDEWDPSDHVYEDRRQENDPEYLKDDRISFFAVRRTDGTPMAALMNFGMHGTTFDKDNDLLLEDSAGGVETKFEERFFQATGQPIVGMFIQSAGGDARPMGGWLGHGSPYQKIEMIGEGTAPTAMDLYDGLEWSDTATLGVRSMRLDLRYSWMGYDEYGEFSDADGEPYLWGALYCEADGVEPGESMEGHPKQCTGVDTLFGMLQEPLPHCAMHQTYLTTARLGPLFFVTMPGEPTYSVTKAIREEIATRDDDGAPLDVLVFGYSQDHKLYLTMPDDWFVGGFESTGGLWGPLNASYYVEQQMLLVDDLLEGYGRPTYYENSPDMCPAVAFAPRAYEKSLNAGAIVADVESGYPRTSQVVFAFGGGDPTVSSPHVVLEAQQEDESWEPVPGPAGWAGVPYDNSRYQMITRYDPDPAPSAAILDERTHNWLVQWEVPADFPAGTYRLVATGNYWDGSALHSYEATSSPFAVNHIEGTTLSARFTSPTTVELNLTLPPTAYTSHEGRWPLTGWRVHDPTVGPNAPINIRAPLRVSFRTNTKIDVEPEPTWLVEWDAEAGAYVFDRFDETGLSAGGDILVSAYLDADHIPAPVTTTLSDPSRSR